MNRRKTTKTRRNGPGMAKNSPKTAENNEIHRQREMGMKTDRVVSSVFICVIRGEKSPDFGFEVRKWSKIGLKTPQNLKKGRF